MCPFCSMSFKEGNAILPGNLSKTNSYTNNRLSNSGNIVLIPDIAPISKFHLLIVPQRHVFNCLTLNQTEKNELFLMKKMVVDFFSFLGLETFFFEHGSCFETVGESSSACIAHAHLHAIPMLAESIERLFNRSQRELVQFPLTPNSKTPYLMMENKNAVYYFKDDKTFKQILRKYIAEEIGEMNRRIWQICLYSEESSKSKLWIEELLYEWSKFRNSQNNA